MLSLDGLWPSSSSYLAIEKRLFGSCKHTLGIAIAAPVAYSCMHGLFVVVLDVRPRVSKLVLLV
eukprot:SAG22_NODE_205_length_15308_cov_20.539023_23_plen_64_part_00